jgi:putative acetyltransferase
MITLRDQTDSDLPALHALIKAAFHGHPFSHGTEPFILEALWQHGRATVALVAEEDGEVVGQVAISPATVGGQSGWHGVGPVAVRPDRQRQGIGSRLMTAALDRLRALGSMGCVLVGSPDYYRRFGFGGITGLTMPGVPGEVILALPFGAAIPQGDIAFDEAFAATAPA